MPKIILEKQDIENLIMVKYPACEILKGLENDLEIHIRVKEVTLQPVATPPAPVFKDGAGNVDADKSGLTLKNREHTIPGGAMGRKRGRLPQF